MSGSIIENLSGRKLAVLVSFLLLCQAACFLLGGLVAPRPASTLTVLATVCADTRLHKNDTAQWLYARGKGACKRIDLYDEAALEGLTADDIVFTFAMPTPKENVHIDFSRWQQNLIGVLQLEMSYRERTAVLPRAVVTLDARLAYRDKHEPDDAWRLYARSREPRHLDCDIGVRREGYHYRCAPFPLFELGSLHHDYYLLNVKLPVDRHINSDIGSVKEMMLTVIHQNGGFVKVWLSLKTVFFPCVALLMAWFWRRVHMLQRRPVLIERMLMAVGGALCLLNLPLEYLTLAFDLPFMLLLSDIRQGLFYTTLFSFWLVFAGEHMLIQETKVQNSLKQYWRHLSAVGVGCASLFAFDMCERGVQLRNPFYSIWVTDLGSMLALAFIILAGISAGIYFLFLCYMVWKVFCNIAHKRAALPTMCSVRRLRYEGIIYRFKFLMLATLICAAMTVIGFILGQVAEGQWKWDEDIELEYTSAFFTGVYGMWNVYIMSLLVLYAPSHKRWPAVDNTSDTQTLSEETEFTRPPAESASSEISALTSFIRKAAIE